MRPASRPAGTEHGAADLPLSLRGGLRGVAQWGDTQAERARSRVIWFGFTQNVQQLRHHVKVLLIASRITS